MTKTLVCSTIYFYKYYSYQIILEIKYRIIIYSEVLTCHFNTLIGYKLI